MSKQTNLLKKIAAYQTQRNIVDYEMAASLHELRKLVGSDADFLATVKNYFHIHGKTLNMWLRTAKFYNKFSKKDWKNFGGREGIQKLEYLTSVQRIKVIKVALAKIAKHKQPLTPEAINYIIRSLGYRTKTPGQGRNRRTEVERRLLLCQNWLSILYKDYELPKMPADVRAASKRTELAKAMQKLAAS